MAEGPNEGIGQVGHESRKREATANPVSIGLLVGAQMVFQGPISRRCGDNSSVYDQFDGSGARPSCSDGPQPSLHRPMLIHGLLEATHRVGELVNARTKLLICKRDLKPTAAAGQIGMVA
jgi:hypothetical protein